MRRLSLVVTLLSVLSCSKSPSAPAPTPAPTAPPDGTAAAIFLTPNNWNLPPGGGSLEIVIATSAHPSGTVAAAHVPVTLRASSGTLSETSPRTDVTGHAKVTWTGTSSATITARAGEIETTATISVQTAAPQPPPPNPNPNPNPSPDPGPGPGPNPPSPNPRPTPPNRGPAGDLVATIIASPANPDANQSVRFSTTLASSTGAALPAIEDYVWDVNGDRLPDRWEPSPTATYAAGTYPVEVEIRTADNRAVSATLSLVVGPTPALSATMTAAPSSVGLGETVTLTANATSTGNVGSLSYAWDVDGNGSTDQTTATNSTTTTYTTIGEKKPKVTVTGSRGSAASATASVEVTAPALSISGLTATSPATANAIVTFTATVTAASGPVPTALSYTWDYGNGSEVITGGPTVNVNHVYGVAGTYKVTVKVTAPDGRTATSTIQVVVN